MPDITEVKQMCPYYKYEDYSQCTIYKQYGYSCNCNHNKIDSYNGKLCFFREDYYKANPQLYMPFGKFKYYQYKEIPDNYLAWLLKEGNIRSDIREYIVNSIIEKQKERIIDKFISDNYQKYISRSSRRSYSSSYSSYSSYDDYDDPLFDAMQGCVPNGF